MASLDYNSLWELMSLYTFEIDDNKDLICILCNRLMIDASQSLCGCRYCYACISNYLSEGNKYCPGGQAKCNDEYLDLLTDVVKDRRTNNRISKLVVKCPNTPCEIRVELSEMGNHLRLCSTKPICCPYGSIGCDNDKTTKDTVVEHLHTDTLSHTQLLIEWIQNMKNEVDGLKESLELTKIEMREELGEKDNMINKLQQDLNDIRNSYRDIERPVESREASIEQASVSQTPSSFTWTINDCSKKIGVNLYSDAFFSNNYKLCLCMFIYGDNVGLNCVIMKGELDNALQWPMTLPVHLSIVNHDTLQPYKTVTLQYNTYCNKSVFLRPNSDKTNYIGVNPFVLYSSIKNNQSVIVNDSIVLSCRIGG